MNLRSLQEYLLEARNRGWAVGHFNVSESDQMRAICEAAAELNTVAMVGTSEGEARHFGYLEAVAFRQEFSIPVFLNADHHKSVEMAKKAVDAGYDSIHIDLSAKSFEENIAGTREVVEYARSEAGIKNKELGINIEGELGYLAGESKVQSEKIAVSEKDYTNPDQALEFVEKAGVNRLAIVVGNIHGISLDEPNLDIERIKKIRSIIPKEVALVLHAGSGILDEQIKAAIAAGIANIHINTDIRVVYTEALRKELSALPDETTPYKFDEKAKLALKDMVMAKLRLFGSINTI